MISESIVEEVSEREFPVIQENSAWFPRTAGKVPLQRSSSPYREPTTSWDRTVDALCYCIPTNVAMSSEKIGYRPSLSSGHISIFSSKTSGCPSEKVALYSSGLWRACNLT
jgi:hypothetical protein